MNRLACLLLGTILFHVGAVSTRAQQGSPEQELIRLEKQWAAAVGDAAFLSRITADEYVIVDASGDVRNKRQELAVSQNEKFQTSTVDDLSVRVYGDSAVALGRYALTGTNMGQPYSETGRFTDVWVKRSGKWRLVSSQNTSLPAAVTLTLPPDQFFIEKEKEVWEALKHKDKAAATRLLADDFVGMYDFGFFNKSEWVKQIDDQYTVDDYTIMNPKVLHPSSNTALLLYTSTCKGTGAWADYCSNTSRISDLWVERNEEWLALFSQDTQATSSQPLPHDDLEGNSRGEHSTGKDAAETVPGLSAATTVVHLDEHTTFTPFDKMIIGKEKEVLDLTAKGDYASWTNLLSDDAVAVYDTGYASKAEVLKSLKGMSDFHCSMDKVKVMPISKTAALVIYMMTQGWKEQGKPMTSQYYISSLWVKRGGKWLSQFWQETDTTNSQGEEEKTLENQNNSANDDTKELLKIDTDLLNAYVHRDLSVRDRYVADEFVGVDGSGNVYSKQQDMRELKEGAFAMKSFTTEGVQVRRFGDSAIVAGRNTATSVYKGKEETSTFRFVDTFLKRDGRWQMVYSQDTNVANTTATSGEPDDAVLKAIVANEKRIMETLQRNDISAFGDMLPDDLIDVEDDGIHTKAEWLKEFVEQKKNGLLFKDFKMDDLRLVRYGPSAATLVFRETIDGMQNGKPFEWHINSSSGYVNRSGKWMPVLYQDTMAK